MTKTTVNNSILLAERQYFIDWIRVLAFALLIFYHTGMMFVDWRFHVESGHNSIFLKSIMILTSQWRLDILFLVSGVAISFMIRKMSLKAFAWQRILKLYIPLLFAISVVVAPQSYYEALQKSVFDGSFWQFWREYYFTFTWDKRMNAPFPTYNHMWYVLYLFHYSIILLPLFAFINRIKGTQLLVKVEYWLVKKARVIWLPIIFYLTLFFIFTDHQINHTFYNDWYGHSTFILATVIGLLLARMPAVWQSFEKNRYLSMSIAVISYAFLLALFLIPNDMPWLDKSLVWELTALMIKWSWIAMLIGFAKRYLNFSNSALKYSSKVVYPFFILHQTVIIILGFYVIDWGLSAMSEFLIIAFGSMTICGFFYEIVIKRINILRLMFGVTWQKNALLKKETLTEQ